MKENGKVFKKAVAIKAKAYKKRAIKEFKKKLVEKIGTNNKEGKLSILNCINEIYIELEEKYGHN